MKLSLVKKALIIIFIIVVADQVLKIWVKTHMFLNETHSIFGDWFLLSFVENDGMAFGWDIPGSLGKIALSIFRIIAVFGIAYYGYSLIKKNPKTTSVGLVICLSMLLAGAMGNIFDSAFYGLFYGHSGYSPSDVASFMPDEGGYQSFLHGSVVDMFRFKITGTWPEWFPWIGGDYFDLFPPVFNIADASITIGIFVFIIFHKRFFNNIEAGKAVLASETVEDQSEEISEEEVTVDEKPEEDLQ